MEHLVPPEHPTRPIKNVEYFGEKPTLTLSGLADCCGSSPSNIKRWLIQAGFTFPLEPAKEMEYIEIVKAHQKFKQARITPKDIEAAKGSEGGSGVDKFMEVHLSKDGLTWQEAKDKEMHRKMVRENTLADKIMREEWMRVESHYQILSMLTSKLEVLPDKLKVELGWSGPQRDKVRAALDQARRDASDETLRAIEKEKKSLKKESAVK